MKMIWGPKLIIEKKEIDYFSGNHLEVLEKKDVSEEKAEKNQNICLLVSFDVINLQQQKNTTCLKL